MPRRSGRMTTTKSHKSKKPRQDANTESETVTQEEWATMKPFGSFLISDDDDNQHKFAKNDIVAILPNGRSPGEELEPWEYWVGLIRDIRAQVHDDDTNSVWAQVQWYYSGKDVSNVIKLFDHKAVGDYERILADHYDFVGPEAVNGLAPMAKLDESDPYQPYIPRDHFYYRYTFERNTRSPQPKPGARSCVCKRPYNPSDSDPMALMHFCPRPSCLRYFHRKCLVNSDPEVLEASTSIVVNSRYNQVARKTASPRKRQRANSNDSSRGLLLLATSPETDDTIDLEGFVPTIVVSKKIASADLEPAKKRLRAKPRQSKATPLSEKRQTLSSTLSSQPSNLLLIAQQPEVRGAAFVLGGISGNIGVVNRARRLVHQILQGENTSDGWEQIVFGLSPECGLENVIVKLEGSKGPLPILRCPQCQSAI